MRLVVYLPALLIPLRPQAIVTGASKGLGKAIAHELAARGYDLLLIARSGPLLESLCKELESNPQAITANYLALDLTVETATPAIMAWCSDNAFQPSVLVNNAGFACWGYFQSLPVENQMSLIQLNIQSAVTLTHAMLPVLRSQPKGYVLNVCSTAAYQAVPTMTLYAASKAFIRSFSRGLRYELRNTSVSVTCLSPGPMATNFIAQANMQALQATANKFEMPAEVVARRGVDAMFRRKAEVIPGVVNYLTVFFSKFIPDALLERIAAGIYETKI